MEDYLEVKATLMDIKDWTIILLPLEISQELPSRGMNMVEILLDDHAIILPIEPDGRSGHWIKVDDAFFEFLRSDDHGFVTFTMHILNDWIKPDCPSYMLSALETEHLLPVWYSLTAKAQWEWLRWIRSTSKSTTRSSRIKTMCSMLNEGKKRPCCFNTQQCTQPYVSKNGLLLLQP